MSTIDELKNFADKYQLTEVKGVINSAQDLAKTNYIDVAVLGQFKAGKSSLINSIIGRDIVPTGVVPVTAIVTRIFYSPEEQITIRFLDGTAKQIPLSQLAQYITEAQNPGNHKHVAIADIGLPQMHEIRNIRLIDTPGLGSIFANNTETTRQWSSQTTIALIVISAERPLSEEDKKLLDGIKKYSYKTYCVLSKIDLFNQQEASEIQKFVSQSLERLFNKHIPVIPYSTKKDTQHYRKQLFDTVFSPLLDNSAQEINKIYNYKLLRAALLIQNYLKIAYQASVRTIEEQRQLKQRIFDNQTSANYLYRQVQLIASDLKSKTREQVEQLLLPHKPQITLELTQAFITQYPSWKGNLYKISRRYEKWLKQTLQVQIQKVINYIYQDLTLISNNAKQHLKFFTDTFTENLRQKLLQNLGVQIKTLEWQAQLPPLNNPDVSVYRAFDSNLDLLWFLFPMPIFKNLFGKQFRKQIPLEVEKNLYRTVSILTGLINNLIEDLAQQAIQYINSYIDTISKALEIKQQHTQQISDDLRRLEILSQKLTAPAT